MKLRAALMLCVHRSLVVLAAALAVAPLACRRKPTPTVTAASATRAPPAPPPVPPPAPPEYAVDPGARAVPPQQGMRRCPVTVEGAYTVIRDVEGGLQIDVVGKTDAVVAEIRTRALRLLTEGAGVRAPKAVAAARPKSAKSAAPRPRDGAGRSGACPIMVLNAVVRTEPLEHGSRFVVAAEFPGDVAWLRAQSRALLEKLEAGR